MPSIVAVVSLSLSACRGGCVAVSMDLSGRVETQHHAYHAHQQSFFSHVNHPPQYSSFPPTQPPVHPFIDSAGSNQQQAMQAAAYYQHVTPGPSAQSWAVLPSDVSYASAMTPLNGIAPITVAKQNNVYWKNINHLFSKQFKRTQKKIKIVQSAWCEICKIDCNSTEVLKQHKLGKKHKKNMEKLLQAKAGPGPAIPGTTNPNNPIGSSGTSAAQGINKKGPLASVSGEDLETKRQKLMAGGAAPEAVRMCSICNVVCNSETVFQFHLSGQKHVAQLKKHTGIGTLVGPTMATTS